MVEKLSDPEFIEEVRRQFKQAKQAATLEKMSKAEKISYVTEKIKKEVDAPTAKRNRGTASNRNRVPVGVVA